MTPSARLRVEVDGKVISQGTAFPCEGYVVTAFHVVGTCESGAWCHELRSGVRYSLALGREVELTPVIADSHADIALFQAGETGLASQLSLIPPSDIEGRPWRTVGFPFNVEDNQFALDGTVTHLSGWWGARDLQLLVHQGTHVLWDGISGAPVIVDGHIVGMVTAYTRNNSTVWACTGGAVRRLISAARSSLLTESSALLAANRFGRDARPLGPTSNFPELVKLLDSLANQSEASGVRQILVRLDAESGPPVQRTAPMILLASTPGAALPMPDLLTPSGPGHAGELSVLFGQVAGDEFAVLSESAISAIEIGDFDSYVDIGQAIQRKGIEVAASAIVHDGESLVADGYRLMAGMRPTDGANFLQIAKNGFGEVLARAPGNARALRGRACCAQAEHNYGDALRSYEEAIEGIQRHIASHAGAVEPLSRRLGDRHELLRLLRHRTEVILLIRQSSLQTQWNTEKGKLQFGQHVEEHERLFRNTMPRMAARADWYDFETFASQVFLAAALNDLGDVEKSAEASLRALRHRRLMVRSSSLTAIQRSNFRWWVRASRKALNAKLGLASWLDDLEEALTAGNDSGVLDSVDGILATTVART